MHPWQKIGNDFRVQSYIRFHKNCFYILNAFDGNYWTSSRITLDVFNIDGKRVTPDTGCCIGLFEWQKHKDEFDDALTGWLNTSMDIIDTQVMTHLL